MHRRFEVKMQAHVFNGPSRSLHWIGRRLLPIPQNGSTPQESNIISAEISSTGRLNKTTQDYVSLRLLNIKSLMGLWN
jgi:hypothetical protein